MASYLGLSCLWTSYFPGKIMWDMRITLETQMASYLGLSFLWTSYLPGKIMWDTRITLRDTNGQLPGDLLFMNFLSSRKDHERHENYSQRHKWPATWGYLVYELLIFQERSCETWELLSRHKWPATWGYLVYELLIFQERSCETQELLSETQMASYLGLSCLWTSYLPGKIMWDMRITLRDTNDQLPGAILFMNFLSSRKDHVRHENYSQRHKWPATWGYLVYELLIFQERSCETWELLSETQMASYLGLSCLWTSYLPGKIMWDLRITFRDTNGQLPGAILFMNFLSSRKKSCETWELLSDTNGQLPGAILFMNFLSSRKTSCETWELLSETQMASYLGLSCLWTSYLPGKNHVRHENYSQTQMASYLGLSCLWTSYLPGKHHVRHENYSRDTNGQLPGAIFFMNFLSSRKDHVRHENYSQRHKWPATWGYLVYELLIFQERS